MAGFSGDPNAYLSFDYLLLHKPSDDPVVYGSSLNGRSVISLSLFPNEARGVLLAVFGQVSMVRVLLLTLSAHAREGYSTHFVCHSFIQSVTLSAADLDDGRLSG